MQGLIMQTGLALALVVLAVTARNEPRNLAFALGALVVPLGWGYAFWSAYHREEAARREGVWTKEWDAKERRRTFGIMGASALAWLAFGALLVVVL